MNVQGKLMLLAADPRNIGRLCELLGSMPNIEFPTMGGLLFWDDLASYKGWRLQQNTFTGHCRVIDPDDVRHAWGSERAMMRALNQLAPVEPERPVQSGNTVDELQKLANLLNEGFISRDEFERLKQQLFT
jgi:hypothetical protein